MAKRKTTYVVQTRQAATVVDEHNDDIDVELLKDASPTKRRRGRRIISKSASRSASRRCGRGKR